MFEGANLTFWENEYGNLGLLVAKRDLLVPSLMEKISPLAFASMFYLIE